MLDDVLKTIDSKKKESLSKLKEFLAIPSVSTKPDHKSDMVKCAKWLAHELQEGGLGVTIHSTKGHPIVVARNKHVAGRPTVLFYGHYDVQPPEPLNEWVNGPFEPTVRDGAIFARGSADDKGQVWCHAQAVLAWQANGGVPVNLIMLVEGEEEIGSDNLEAFVNEQKENLKADIAVISDTNQFAKGIPAITYGLRGLCYAEIFLTGPSYDLHSGLYGGAVPNPANVLGEIIGSLHEKNGRVLIDGFYDDVVDLTATERAMWKKLPFSEDEFAEGLGIPHGNGEEGFTSLERSWARPTCDVNGITTGYQGPGAKTVIASTASAKISMRLVPNQDPAKIQQAFEAAIKARCPDNVKLQIKWYGASEPVLVPIDSKSTNLAAEALKIGFGKEPTFMRGGGSIPVVGLIKRVLGIDTLLIGFGLPDDHVHSPNEKFDLDALYGGTRTAAALYDQLRAL